MPIAEKTRELAKALRTWESENPWVAAGIGFIPGVGQAYGLASTAALAMDPEATKTDYALDALGYIPGGRLIKGVKNKMIGGPETLERMADLGVKNIPENRRYLDPEIKGDKRTDAQRQRIVLPDPQFDWDKMRAAFLRDPPGQYIHHNLNDFMKDTPANQKLLRIFPELHSEFRIARPDYMQDQHGGYFDTPNYGGIELGAPFLRAANNDPKRDLGKTLSHELQHGVQKRVEQYPEPHLGSSMAAAGGDYWKYAGNPGEIEARLNALLNHGKGGQFPIGPGSFRNRDPGILSRALKQYTEDPNFRGKASEGGYAIGMHDRLQKGESW